MRHHDTVFRTIPKPVPWFGSALVEEHGAYAPIAFLLLRLAQVTRAAFQSAIVFARWVRAHSCLCEHPDNCSSHLLRSFKFNDR